MLPKYISLFVFFIYTSVLSQNNFRYDVNNYPLHTKEQCKKAEKIVLKMANYIINNPLDKKNKKRINIKNFLQKWIIQTPDYYFEIPEEILIISKNNKALKTVHKALLVKYVLTHKNTDTKSKKVRIIILISFLRYIENPKNKVIITKELKKYIHLKNNNELYKLIP